jgi:hypothetical protein
MDKIHKNITLYANIYITNIYITNIFITSISPSFIFDPSLDKKEIPLPFFSNENGAWI